ncbi:MAG: putative polysaccharide biosynthesis protein [Symbiobacteriia bacterium]
MEQGPSQSLTRGTTILLAANTWSRVVDFAYRIYLVRLVGAEMIGAFQVVLPFYLLLLILGSAGIPAAVANLVAERRSRRDPVGIERLMRLSLGLTSILGTTSTLLLLVGARPLVTFVLRDPRLYLMLLAMAPSLAAVAVSAVYRGYFQGQQTIWPVALSQLLEQLTQVTVTLVLLTWVVRSGPEATLTGLGIGVTCSELAGLITLMVIYQRFTGRARGLSWRWRPAEAARVPERADLPAVVALAWPTTLTRLLGSVSLMANAVVIPARLMATGVDRHGATALYGQLTGMAMTLVSFPSLITFALAYNLIPAISAAYARKDLDRIASVLRRSLLLVLLVTLPAATILTLLAASLTTLAFATTGPALSLALLAVVSPFLHVEQIMTGVLQGLSKPAVALRNFAAGEALSLVLVILFVPSVGIAGAALGWAIGFVVEAFLDYRAAMGVLKLRLNLPGLAMRPLLAVLPAATILLWLDPGPLQAASPGLTVALAAAALAVYLLGLAALGVTPRHVRH